MNHICRHRLEHDGLLADLSISVHGACKEEQHDAVTAVHAAEAAATLDPTRSAITGGATDIAGRKSKTLLMLFEIFGLGLCGVDRLFLNGCGACGIIKLLTWGGCIIWALIDTVAIIANAPGNEEGIDSLGMKAWFQPETQDAAYYLAYVWIGLTAVSFISSIIGALHHKQ